MWMSGGRSWHATFASGRTTRGGRAGEKHGQSSAWTGSIRTDAWERLSGWGTHYAIGITFAPVVLAVRGLSWACSPMPMLAIAVWLVTLAALPLFIYTKADNAVVSSNANPR